MNHRAAPEFWDLLHQLPATVRQLAEGNFDLLKQDARHPSLRMKRVKRYWSVRIGLHYRALAIEDGDDLLWFWVGHHSEYDKLIGR